MFVARLKSKDKDFCYRLKDALNAAGMSASSYPLHGERKYRCVTYSLIFFSIIKAIREDTERAVEELIRPLPTTRVMKCFSSKVVLTQKGVSALSRGGTKSLATIFTCLRAVIPF